MAATQPVIALVGFMAAGKSTAAKAIGKKLGERYVDTDDLIVRRIGCPIEEFFAREGEAAFRTVEEEVVLEALGDGSHGGPGGVVSLGGGAVGSARIREALGPALVVWCRVREEVAWERSADSGRPLASDRDAFRRLHAEREPLYREVADVVLPKGGFDMGEAAAPWLAAMRERPGLRMAWARTSSAEYPVIVGQGATDLLAPGLAPSPGVRLFGICDPLALSGEVRLPDGLELVLETPGGEREKTLETAGGLLGRLAEAGARRDDAVVAVGGGVVGDMAGFCAAVYQRGIPVTQVPTTLVAQVDSAIGGKTGVDLPEAKNYVGSFHQPHAVLTDPRFLASLPPEELAAGFAEVVKTALIRGGSLWGRVREMSRLTAAGVSEVVYDCAETKIAVVAEDEREGGRRAVLNLGHTVGHAIETVTGYERYRHGEAISLGLLVALRLSGLEDLRAEVAALLGSAGLPTELDPAIDPEAVIAATSRDKKARAGGLGYVLVRAPGEVEHGCEVAQAEVLAAVKELRR